MDRYRRQRNIAIVPVVLLFLCFSRVDFAVSKSKLDSRWREAPVIIDGKDSEWESAATLFEKEKLRIGLMNDEDFLYVGLGLPERTQMMQALFQGLFVWFDPKGGKKKSFGIRFPVGLRSMDFDRPAASEDPPGRGQARPDPEELNRRLVEMLRLVEVILDGKATRRPSGEFPGIAAGVSARGDGLFCELKVPLGPSDKWPYSIAITPERPLGVGLETPGPRRPQSMSRPGGMGGTMGDGGTDDPEAGGGSMSGGMGGGGGLRSGGGRRMPQMEPVKVWIEVRLASPEAQ